MKLKRQLGPGSTVNTARRHPCLMRWGKMRHQDWRVVFIEGLAYCVCGRCGYKVRDPLRRISSAPAEVSKQPSNAGALGTTPAKGERS
jgi:hypothetical protein